MRIRRHRNLTLSPTYAAVLQYDGYVTRSTDWNWWRLAHPLLITSPTVRVPMVLPDDTHIPCVLESVATLQYLGFGDVTARKLHRQYTNLCLAARAQNDRLSKESRRQAEALALPPSFFGVIARHLGSVKWYGDAIDDRAPAWYYGMLDLGVCAADDDDFRKVLEPASKATRGSVECWKWVLERMAERFAALRGIEQQMMAQGWGTMDSRPLRKAWSWSAKSSKSSTPSASSRNSSPAVSEEAESAAWWTEVWSCVRDPLRSAAGRMALFVLRKTHPQPNRAAV